jgi:hypothetical protein
MEKPRLRARRLKNTGRYTPGKCTACGGYITFETAPNQPIGIGAPDPLGETYERLKEAFENHLEEKHGSPTSLKGDDWLLITGED